MEEGNIIDQDQFGQKFFRYNQKLNLPDRSSAIKRSYGNNYIHPTAIIGDDVRLGEGNYIGANCYIVGDTQIGNNNHFEAFCSIGTPPEHKEFFDKKEFKGVLIGNNNVIREFVTINAGCTQLTIIGDGCWLLKGSHVGHDCLLEDKVTLSCQALVGGYSYVMEGANFGLGAICHQRSVIGAYSLLGMGAIVTKNAKIMPFNVYVGNPAKFLRNNNQKVYLFKLEDISKIVERYHCDVIKNPSYYGHK